MQAMIDELAKQAAESLGQVSSKETLVSFWQEYGYDRYGVRGEYPLGEPLRR